MLAEIIDGRAQARLVLEQVAAGASKLPRPPGLAVIIAGDDPASHVYVRSKVRRATEVGFHTEKIQLPEDCGEARILEEVAKLNARDEIDGILVQLPLPKGVNTLRVMAAVDPAKDVDGLHALNAGMLTQGSGELIPCTPSGCMKLIKSVIPDLTGTHSVVIGASNIVGKPMAALLLAEHSTVTLCHIHTRDTQFVCRGADIIVSAVGKPGLVRGDWIKPRAVVIDVGTTRVPDGKGGFKLKGDVEFDEAVKVAGAITPVPGGVGPMTIACLMENTLTAAIARRERAEGAWPVLS